MSTKIYSYLNSELEKLKETGLYKYEYPISTSQGAHIKVNGKEVLNFCSNNYLGLSSHPEVIKAAKEAVDKWGYGMSSVRFICGTQEIHKVLEEKISRFLGMEDSILYAACFDANGGVFEALFNEEDAIISDRLNHASIIDGIRLCKAQRFLFKHADMNDLEDKLKNAQKARFRIIVTDGVFSMDGDLALLKDMVFLKEKYDALLMVDDSHATGFIGKTGRGTHEYWDVMGKVDIITSTLGKALGGAMGGFVSSKKQIIEMLRQRSRPYLFSNSLSPIITYTATKILDILSETTALRDKLEWNTMYFREQIKKAGFVIKDGITPIVPIMLYDEVLAHKFARRMIENGIYVVGFSYPVVPKGEARIRVQLSAQHSKDDIDKCVASFKKVKEELKV